MEIKTLINFISKSPLLLMYRIGKVTKEYSRVGFVLTGISEGIFDIMRNGSFSCEEIQKSLGSDFNQEGFKAWLDLGVSLGELKKDPRGYTLKGDLSKELSKASNDTWRAYLQARAEIFYEYIIKTPSMLKENKRFEFSDSYGELFARSSRTLEPVIYDIVEEIIPKNESCRLLEVGCGSGIYIKRACDLNSKLTAVGLELQPNVADFARRNIINWHLEDRVSIEAIDIRDYKGSANFDLVTFHNLIYYFSVDERADLLRRLGEFLKPGGELIVTTLCQGKDISLTLMNLWTSMTEGCGPLPYPKQIYDQFKKAGYDKIAIKTPFPSFKVIKAIKIH